MWKLTLNFLVINSLRASAYNLCEVQPRKAHGCIDFMVVYGHGKFVVSFSRKRRIDFHDTHHTLTTHITLIDLCESLLLLRSTSPPHLLCLRSLARSGQLLCDSSVCHSCQRNVSDTLTGLQIELLLFIARQWVSSISR
jgi:hypothetical protein